MYKAKALVALVVLVVGALVFFQCTDNPVDGDGDGDGDSDVCEWPHCEPVAPGCDPDSPIDCSNEWFYCETDSLGNKECRGQNPTTPDDGNWDCRELPGGMIECTGDHYVPDSEGWVCTETSEGSGEWICRRHGTFPSDGSDGIWDCYYDGEFRVCVFREESGEPGDGDGDSDSDGDTDGDTDSDADADIPGEGRDECPPGVEMPTDEVCDDGVDNNCDGRVDEACTGGESTCVCTPRAWRYCDTPDYCLWGQQVCDDDGMAWGPCTEIDDIPETCRPIASWYSPAAEACCIQQGQCCQDMWDLDHDGDTWESLPEECPAIQCVDPTA